MFLLNKQKKMIHLAIGKVTDDGKSIQRMLKKEKSKTKQWTVKTAGKALKTHKHIGLASRRLIARFY